MTSPSDLFHVSVDYLVKDEECEKTVSANGEESWQEVADFRAEAAESTYAGYARRRSHPVGLPVIFLLKEGITCISTLIWAQRDFQVRK